MTDTIDTTTAGPATRVRALLDEVLSGSEAFPVEVVVRGRGGSQVIDVYVDSPGPIGSDDLARISRALGDAIDTETLVPGPYRLDVSTPGLERPLQDIRQYGKHVGRPLQVRLVPGEQGAGESRAGTLVAVDGDVVVLRGEDGAEDRVPLESIAEAKIQLPW